MNASEIEQALHAIVPSASPEELMQAVVQHTIATSQLDPKRKRKRAKRQHGAFVRKREQDQSRQYNLRLDLIDLQRQIAQLTQLRDLLQAQVLNTPEDNDGSLVRMASLYYDVMAGGYQDVVVNGTRRIDTRAYLEAVLSNDVRLGRFCGREYFRPMMQRYSTYFSGNRLQLTDAHVVLTPDNDQGEVLVRTTGAYGAWLTPYTVSMMFPHIISERYDRLVMQLLRRPLEGECTYDFIFDRTTGQVIRFDAEMNFLPAFMRLVPDPLQLAFLFSQAKITEEMFIGDDNYLEEVPDTTPPQIVPHSDIISSPMPDTSDDESCVSSTSSSASRHLKMADLLSSDDHHGDNESLPSVSLA